MHFAGVYIVNSLDTYVGSFVKHFFKGYSSFMAFRFGDNKECMPTTKKIPMAIKLTTVFAWLIMMVFFAVNYFSDKHIEGMT